MSTAKDLFSYEGSNPGVDLPGIDSKKPLPASVQPTLRYQVNFGLKLLQQSSPQPPASTPSPSPQPPKLGIVGVTDLLKFDRTGTFMPSNLTRMRPDKFSDDFFVERRLNGFNPGKLNRIEGQAWQYAVRYDCSGHRVDPSGILPKVIEARFTYDSSSQSLACHSIAYELNILKVECRPGDSEWERAKRLFRCAEFVFQEVQSHLARTHMNLGQYAMAYYRNIENNPIRLLLQPHFEGLLNINSLGASLIKGETGFIPEASSLDPTTVDTLILAEVKKLNYHGWSPKIQALPDAIANNHFDRAALAMWDVLQQYVGQFFQKHEAGIKAYWSEIEEMSDELVTHSILDSGTLAIANLQELQELCVYVIYLSSFFHSWVNNKQYEDGGDISYATIGLWDENHPAYDPVAVAQRYGKQVSLLWTLSHVRYNPIMDTGPTELKNLLLQRRQHIEPGIPLEAIMMSTNI
jgi:linolenate 9R-lipoxygenase